MKKFFIIGLTLFFFSANAQPTEKQLKKHQEKIAESKTKNKVVLSLDTIYKSGVPYAVLKEKKVMLTSDYSLYSLTGKELVDIPYECVDDNNSASGMLCYYAFLFLQSGKRGEIEIGIGDKIEKIIVECDLVKDNDINPSGENKFLMKNPPKYSNKPQNNGTTVIVINNGNTSTVTGDMYQTVERKRDATIYVFGEELKQDFKVIGSAKKQQKTISFYLPNGTKIAEATSQNYNDTQWKIVTLKDNKVHNTSTSFGSDTKDLAKYLTDLYYL